ncbi:MAG: hypothetical protein WKF92_15725 [Pyrinomonadaceae bacterium]
MIKLELKNSLPFEDKNESDFNSITEKIGVALSTIENDANIPATCEQLANLAGCARKTLNNRGWPIVKLRQIKTERKKLKEEKTKKRDFYADEENVKSNEEILLLRVENFQRDNGRMFEQVQSLTEQLASARELAASLDKTVNNLKEENFNLQNRLRSASTENVSTVVDINWRKR